MISGWAVVPLVYMLKEALRKVVLIKFDAIFRNLFAGFVGKQLPLLFSNEELNIKRNFQSAPQSIWAFTFFPTIIITLVASCRLRRHMWAIAFLKKHLLGAGEP